MKITFDGDFFKWIHCLSAPEWKILCYIAYHCDDPDLCNGYVSRDELLYGKHDDEGLLETKRINRQDNGTGLAEKYLDTAIESLVRDGLLYHCKWIVSEEDMYAVDWSRVYDPEALKHISNP